MIGVIANPADREVVAEFFELFKTPWEFYRAHQQYDVLLCADDELPAEFRAGLTVIYAGRRHSSDAENWLERLPKVPTGRLTDQAGIRIPLYGNVVAFSERGKPLLQDVDSQRSVAYVDQSSGAAFARIGYDLFGEVRFLLTTGQPPLHASLPTLELHIAILRDLIVDCGVSLMEIPPVPAGYKFIACLTHDVDHPSIRRHGFDHTTFGFLYRATIGSLLNVFRGRGSWTHLWRNWIAALKLPFVHLGLAKDFWCVFDQFSRLEGDTPSTFFVIPFKGKPGQLDDRSSAPSKRAASYGAGDIRKEIRALHAAGSEIGLHGIDAWRDVERARAELDEVRSVAGTGAMGVRMHWLYWEENSPVVLDAAGAMYDSTVGYNGEVGYRAGTAQVYKPLNAKWLLELPLIIMDTALFFPSHLHLTRAEAKARVATIIDNAERHGGCITVNWHDRSIAPERLWGDFYQELIEELRDRGAWVASGAEIVTWFRQRRGAQLHRDPGGEVSISPLSDSTRGGDVPALRVASHTRGASARSRAQLRNAVSECAIL